MSQIVYNAIRCPDGVVIESRHRWDFVKHTQEDGRYYAVDGGLSYCKRVSSDDDYVELLLTLDDKHETIREYFNWKSLRDENFKPLKKPIITKLKDLDTKHIENILKDLANWPAIREVLKNELKYRDKVRKLYAVDYAVASQRLEGLKPSQEVIEALYSWAEGELEINDVQLVLNSIIQKETKGAI